MWKTFPARRAGALWMLLCWLWFSTAASLLHTHSLPSAERGGPILTAAAKCLSCQWMACEKSAAVSPPPTAPLPQTIAQVFLESRPAPARVALFLTPSRAPPSWSPS